MKVAHRFEEIRNVAEPVTIAVDVMGGDRGPAVVLRGALQALEADPDLRLTLVGLPDSFVRCGSMVSPHKKSARTIRPCGGSKAADFGPDCVVRLGYTTRTWTARAGIFKETREDCAQQ